MNDQKLQKAIEIKDAIAGLEKLKKISPTDNKTVDLLSHIAHLTSTDKTGVFTDNPSISDFIYATYQWAQTKAKELEKEFDDL